MADDPAPSKGVERWKAAELLVLGSPEAVTAYHAAIDALQKLAQVTDGLAGDNVFRHALVLSERIQNTYLSSVKQDLNASDARVADILKGRLIGY